jgi:PKD repeat protein
MLMIAPGPALYLLTGQAFPKIPLKNFNMKMNLKKYAICLLAMCSLAACQEDELSLEGTASVASFNFQIVPSSLPDTLPFEPVGIFTSTSQDAFIHRWTFGDGSPRVMERDPVHTFRRGGNLNVTLITVGTNGNSEVARTVTVPTPCDDANFNLLTGCGSKEWLFSSATDAIRVLSADGSEVFFAGPGAGCQVDDTYRFFANGQLAYEANGETFVAQAGFTCQPALSNATSFQFVRRAGQNPLIVLNGDGLAQNPFLGTTDVVQNNAYEIVELTEDNMTLRGFLLDGARIEVKFQVATAIGAVKLLLTGGDSKTWKLADAAAPPFPIVVGPEGNPAEFFSGGPLASCQLTDRYTFTMDDQLIYDSGGETFVAEDGFTCQPSRSYTTNYVFSSVSGPVAGLAQITLNNDNLFIGVTDRAQNVYRIIEINENLMVLRAGDGSTVTHTMRFIPAD